MGTVSVSPVAAAVHVTRAPSESPKRGRPAAPDRVALDRASPLRKHLLARSAVFSLAHHAAPRHRRCGGDVCSQPRS